MSPHGEWCHQTGKLPREDEESYGLFDLWTVSDYPSWGKVTLNNDALTSHPWRVCTTGHQMCRAGTASFPMVPWAACVPILLSGFILGQDRPPEVRSLPTTLAKVSCMTIWDEYSCLWARSLFFGMNVWHGLQFSGCPNRDPFEQELNTLSIFWEGNFYV